MVKKVTSVKIKYTKNIIKKLRCILINRRVAKPLFYYSNILINLNDFTSNSPLSVTFISGITGSDKNESVKNGLKSMFGAI